MLEKDFDKDIDLNVNIPDIDFSLPKLSIKSDFTQWYDSAFYPSDEADDYIRRVKIDNPLPWVMHDDIFPLIHEALGKKISSFFVSEGDRSGRINPSSWVEAFDMNGDRLGVMRYHDLDSRAYWVREVPEEFITSQVIRLWRFGAREAIIFSNPRSEDFLSKDEADHRLADVYYLSDHDRVASAEHIMLLNEIVKLKDGQNIPWRQVFVPDVDGFGLEKHIDPQDVYVSLSAWKIAIG